MRFEVENIGKPWSQERMAALESLAGSLGVAFNSPALEHQHATKIFTDRNNVIFVSRDDATFFQICNGSLDFSRYVPAREMMQNTGCRRSQVEGKLFELAIAALDAIAVASANGTIIKKESKSNGN